MGCRRVISVFSLIAISILLAACHGKTIVKLQPEDLADSEVSRLLIPDVVEVLSVDGKEIPAPGISVTRSLFELQLEPGLHEFRLRLNYIWNLNREQYKKILSKPKNFVLDAKPAKIYRVNYSLPFDPEGLEKGDDPEIWITENGADAVTEDIKPSKAGDTGHPAKIGAVPAATAAPAPKKTSAVEQPLNIEILTVLKALWLRATEQERHEFSSWTRSQK